MYKKGLLPCSIKHACRLLSQDKHANDTNFLDDLASSLTAFRLSVSGSSICSPVEIHRFVFGCVSSSKDKKRRAFRTILEGSSGVKLSGACLELYS